MHNERMGGDAERDAELMHGLPQTRRSSLTPAGEIEQFGKMATGVRVRREGWRRVVVPIGLILLAIVVVSAIVAGTLSHS